MTLTPTPHAWYHLWVYRFHVFLKIVFSVAVAIHTLHILNLGGFDRISLLRAPTYFMHKLFNIFTNIIIQQPPKKKRSSLGFYEMSTRQRARSPVKTSKVWPICCFWYSDFDLTFSRLYHNWSRTTKGWGMKTRHLWRSYQVTPFSQNIR